MGQFSEAMPAISHHVTIPMVLVVLVSDSWSREVW
jgi:hypothetical protein